MVRKSHMISILGLSLSLTVCSWAHGMWIHIQDRTVGMSWTPAIKSQSERGASIMKTTAARTCLSQQHGWKDPHHEIAGGSHLFRWHQWHLPASSGAHTGFCLRGWNTNWPEVLRIISHLFKVCGVAADLSVNSLLREIEIKHKQRFQLAQSFLSFFLIYFSLYFMSPVHIYWLSLF